VLGTRCWGKPATTESVGQYPNPVSRFPYPESCLWRFSMAVVKKPEMAEKKGAAIRRITRYERQMEGLEETAALQDIQETKGVSRLG